MKDDPNGTAEKWIEARETRGKVVEQWEILEEHFPDGPKKPLGAWVHLVVVTQDSAYRHV